MSGRVIFMRLLIRPSDWLARLTTAGIVAGPAGGPGAVPGEFWIGDDGSPAKTQVGRVLEVLDLPPGSVVAWSDPTEDVLIKSDGAKA